MLGDMRFRTRNCEALGVYEVLGDRVFLLRTANGNYFKQTEHADQDRPVLVEHMTFGNAVNLFESDFIQRFVSFEQAFPDGVKEW